MSQRRDERWPILLALMISMALAAIDSTIVTTAVPSIVRDLGGFSLFPWLFSVYLLAQAVTTPIYGRMADLFGRKRVLFFGIGVFLLGSILSGLAWNMVSLIAFRAIQGIGAGAIVPLVMTVLGDLYSVSERARVQGYLASVWAMASVLGPLAGGSLTQYVSWRWIFYINLPIGIMAALMLQRRLKEAVTARRHKIDYLGAAVLSAGLVLVIFGLLQGGSAWAWTSRSEELVLLVGVLLLVGFVFVERVACEPILPGWIISRRPLASGNLANVAIGAAQLGFLSYVPTFVQGVREHGPIVAGLTVSSLTIGWPLAVSFSGKLYLRIGFRATALIGAAVTLVAAVLFVPLGEHTSVWTLAGLGFVMGAGFGMSTNPILVGLQSTVDWNRRGIVTGSNIFSRTLGSAVGVAVLGSIANTSLARWMAHPARGLTGQLPRSLESVSSVLGGAHTGLSARATSFVRLGLFHAVHDVFIGIAVLGVAVVVAVLFLPRHIVPLRFAEEEPVETVDPSSDDLAPEAAIG